MAGKIISGYKPDVVIGTGGYASGPVLYVAGKRNIPTLIQEQNSYPGVTNKILAKKAGKICVAYEGMEKYFPRDKILVTGNPVREDLENKDGKVDEGMQHFKLNPEKKTLLILGGSLGARTINRSVKTKLEELGNSGIQVLWQCGSLYLEDAAQALRKNPFTNIQVRDFITRMDLAYAVADLVISRAGAGTISELSLVAKASILVPSPNVAADHQTKNALALAHKDASVLIRDAQAEEILIPRALELIRDDNKLSGLSGNIKKFAKPGSADIIADEVIRLCKT